MRVLFIPLPQGSLPHLFPLLALNEKIRDAAIETAFLAPARLREALRYMGINVLDFDYSNRLPFPALFRTELRAYSEFSPNVVVDDTNPPTAFATAIANLPRVTIHRYGMFPGSEPKDLRRRYANEFFSWEITDFPDVSYLGVPQPKSMLDFFKADLKIVPGTKSIETFGTGVEDDPSYHFAGPLLVQDLLMDRIADAEINGKHTLMALEKFFTVHRQRPKVFVTFGTTAKARPAMLERVRALLNRDVAIVTSVGLGDLITAERERVFHAPWLPMNYVCSQSDLMIHQCGTGTYQYALSHRLPGVTVGTEYYEMETIAMRLQDLGVSAHLPSPDREEFKMAFEKAISSYFDSPDFLEEKRRNLSVLHREIQETKEAFDFERLLQVAAAKSRSKINAPA